mgnify:FL=1
MADAVTSQTIFDAVGSKHAIMKFTNISDGTGESSVEKVDVASLAKGRDGTSCSKVDIEKIWYDIGGMRVDIEWNATSNVKALVLGGSAAAGNVQGHLNFSEFGGIKNTEASGYDGDIDLTTHGHTNHDHYTIIMKLKKTY